MILRMGDLLLFLMAYPFVPKTANPGCRFYHPFDMATNGPSYSFRDSTINAHLFPYSGFQGILLSNINAFIFNRHHWN